MNLRKCLRTTALTVLCVGLGSAVVRGQEIDQPVEAPDIKQPMIAEEPRTVDPATLVPDYLAARVKVTFEETSLREVGKWIEEQQKIPVLFDAAALSEAGIPLGEPVTDRLADAPLYLLLNRLRSLGLSWYVDDKILHITTQSAAGERLTTEPYNVADLLDAGYKLDDLSEAISSTTSGPWSEIDGTGGAMQWLGDVQFIRQTVGVHREVAGLLTALRKHGRQTMTLDPPEHLALRQKLEQNVDVRFQDVPLVRAIAELAEKAGADIRLNVPSLRKGRVREREPVSLALTERRLGTVLDVLLNDLGLTWILRDGVLWITSREDAEKQLKTAVYDVRDLCRDLNESSALGEAIQSQTAGPWTDVAGTGGSLVFAKSGTLVVRQTERGLTEVLSLLETYRKALRASKPRKRETADPNEVVTRYYRMHTQIAQDLQALLIVLVEPESWKSEQKPEAPGTIMKVSSVPMLLNASGQKVVAAAGAAKSPADALVVPQSVLIIRQSRKLHLEVANIITLVEHGDPPELGMGLGGIGGYGDGLGGGLGGSGGFGSGFFSVPD